jgi:hypothetical protein
MTDFSHHHYYFSAMDQTTASIARDLAKKQAEHQDKLIRQAINNHLGREDWALDEVLPHMRLVTSDDSDLQAIEYDSTCIMVIGPVESTMEETKGKTQFITSRRYKILNEPNDEPSKQHTRRLDCIVEANPRTKS